MEKWSGGQNVEQARHTATFQVLCPWEEKEDTGILIARDSEFKVTVEGFRGAFSVFKVLLLIRT